MRSPQRVLVIDDHIEIRDALAICLSASGFVVQVAESREAALDILRHTPTQLILMDWFMPGMEASVFVDQVQNAYPHTPIIMMSCSDEVRFEAERLGLRQFLIKPFDLYELPEVLTSAVRELVA